MIEVRETTAGTILTPQKVGSLSGHYDFSLNPYAGCAFSCSYCYVPKFPNARHDYMDWGKWVDVKINAPELIRNERTKVFGARIFFSSATDPYQYLELKYRLTRRCLSELLKYDPAHITLHTRSHLILQDIDLLKKFGDKLSVGVSFTTDNDLVRNEFEPKAPSIQRRLEVLKGLSEAGINVFVSMSPLLPCDARKLCAMVAPYAEKMWIDNMRSTEVNTRPDLIEKYAEHFDPRKHASLVNEIRCWFATERARYKQEKQGKMVAQPVSNATQAGRRLRGRAPDTVPKGERPAVVLREPKQLKLSFIGDSRGAENSA